VIFVVRKARLSRVNEKKKRQKNEETQKKSFFLPR